MAKNKSSKKSSKKHTGSCTIDKHDGMKKIRKLPSNGGTKRT